MKYPVVCCLVMLLFLTCPLFSQEDATTSSELYTDNVITIYVIGYWSKCEKDLKTAIKFDDIFMTRVEKENEDDPAGYFENSQKKLNEYYDNVFSYSSSNGFDKNRFRINGYKPDQLADVIVREIGDFVYGSQVIRNTAKSYDAFKQCMIGLAKTEWVFMQYIKRNNLSDIRPRWDDSDASSNDRYKELVLSFGPFLGLLSREYITHRLESNATLSSFLNPGRLKSTARVAEELTALAWQCPNRINFVAHSQGGMYLFRYLNGNQGGENLYGYNTGRVNESLYHFYQNYTSSKFENERTYYNSSQFFRGYETLSSLGQLVPTTEEGVQALIALLKTLDYDYWNAKIADNFSGKNIENITLSDADILLYLLFVKERENAVCRVATEDAPLLGSVCPDFWVKFLEIFGDAKAAGNAVTKMAGCFLSNLVIEAVSSAGYFYSLGMGGATSNFFEDFFVTKPLVMLLDALVVVCMPFIPAVINYVFVPMEIHGYLFKDLHNFFSSNSSQLSELNPNSPLIRTYKNSRTVPDQLPWSPEPVQIYTTSYSGAPTIRGALNLQATYLNIVMGYTQRLLIHEGFIALHKLIAQRINYGAGFPSRDIANSEHLLVGLMESILGALFFKNPNTKEGSLLVPSESSRGEGIAWLNNTNYHLEKTTEDFLDLKDMYESAMRDTSHNPFDYEYWYNASTVSNEIFGLHGWNISLLAYKIFMINNSLVFFESSPYKNKMTITDKRGRSAGSLGDIPFENDKRRNLYAHIFFDQPAGFATINNISIPETNNYGNHYVPEYSAQPFNTGLECNFCAENSYKNKPVSCLTTATYVRVLPIILYNYYDGLETYFSINGRAFTKSLMVDDIDAYARDHINDNDASVVFNGKGEARVVSPHFKEGFNTITFKFVDLFGRSRMKSLVVEQNLIPPFIKPLYPLMNQYINDASCTLRLQAFDISRTKPVDRWFVPRNCTLLLDGQPLPLSAANMDQTDYTIQVPVSGLASGNHTVYFKVDYRGSINERSFRFWVDTTPPEIEFGPDIVFSNADPESRQGFGALITDTVPFTEQAGEETVTYPVDTVLLTKVTIAVDDTIELCNKDNVRLGDHREAWNGWHNGVPLNHGYHSLTVSATDKLGNITQNSKQFIIDNRAPLLNTVRLNTTLVNTKAGAVELTYNLGLDEWEDQGAVEITFVNQTLNETFTLEHAGQGNTDILFPIAYMSEGANMVKDGVYTISVVAKDAYGNRSAPVQFHDVVVDMFKPVIEQASASPFVLKNNNYDVVVTLQAAEHDPVEENKSPSLEVHLALEDQYGQAVASFPAHTASLVPGVPSRFTFTVPRELTAGKYFFKASVNDKNDNTREEYVPFIKDAVSPEISYPPELAIIDSEITIRGNAGDPRWDNNLTFDHYELYYRFGDAVAVPDLDNLDDGWLHEYIRVPAYQMRDESHQGAYPIQDDGILGFLDASRLPNGLLTLLLIAVEEGGYKIATSRTIRILYEGDRYAVDIIMDPAFANATVPVNFADREVSIEYTVQNEIDNPVDLFAHIKDADGAIVKDVTYLNMQSRNINGHPVIGTGERGVFVWDENGTTHVLLKNDQRAEASFMVIITADAAFSNCRVISEDPVDSHYLNLLEDGRRIVCSRVLKPEEGFHFSFTAEEYAGMVFNSVSGGEIAPLYLGVDKIAVPGGHAVIYRGADYPPLRWDGKDEWNRYVKDDTYTITLEALGRRGGHDTERTFIMAATPLLVTINSAQPADKRIQPGMGSVGSYAVHASINKTANLRVEILNAAGEVVRTLEPDPPAITERGSFTFVWNGDNDAGALCPRGFYGVRLHSLTEDGVAHVVDGGTIPEFGNIEITDVYAYNTAIPAELHALSETRFQGEELVRGDTSYTVTVEPRGKYVPDKEAKLTLDAKGTQVVKALPDMDYMAGIRVNYEELYAEVSYRGKVHWKVKSRAESPWDHKDDSDDGDKYSPTYIETDIRLVSYTIETETMNRFYKTISFVYSGSDSFTQPKDEMFPVPTPPFGIPVLAPFPYKVKSKDISPSLEVSILKGRAYTTCDTSTVVNSFTHSESGRNVTVHFTVTYTLTVKTKPETGPNPPGTFRVENYLSYCDAMAAMSPDIRDEEAPYVYITPFVYKDMPVPPSQEIFDGDDLYASTNLSNDPGHPNNPQDITEVWRKHQRLYFYAIGEQSVSRESSFGIPGGVTEEPHEFVPGTVSDYISNMQEGETREYTNGAVFFTLTKQDNRYTVGVTTDAVDQILYPYPTPVAEIADRHIIEDPEVGIARTSINGTRVNGLDFTPNYHVLPEDVIQGSDSIREFTTDFIYENGTYRGEYAWDEVASAYDVPEINFKVHRISDFTAYNAGTENDPQGVLTRDDVNLPDVFPLNNNLPISLTPAVDDHRFDWHLAMDPLVGRDLFTERNQQADLDSLNRYGVISNRYIAGFYPRLGTTTDTSMFLIDATDNSRTDNPHVIVTTETGGSYIVNLLSIDGENFKGMASGHVLYSGNKLLDNFDILLTSEAPKALVPVYGTAPSIIQDQSLYEIQYYNGRRNAWVSVPVYNPDPEKHVLTYWDVTDLPAGLYLVRLISKTMQNGTVEMNVAEKPVYIGQVYAAASSGDQVFSSPFGNAQVIFPEGLFPEDTLVDVTPVDYDSISDIALLPKIAPVGKVIRLTPEGMNFAEPVQLQFTYHRLQIQDADPDIFTIYNITAEGALVPLNTMKKYIRVNFDSAGNVVSEEEGTKEDFTYVRVWAPVSHFSYYTVLEGDAALKPVLDQKDFSTNLLTADFSGRHTPHETIAMYRDDDPYFSEPDETPSLAGQAVCDDQGRFAIENVPLPLEGKNYFFFGSLDAKASEIARITVTRDTTPPALTVEPKHYVLSPNGDNVMDSCVIPAATSEDCEIRLVVTNEYGEQVYDKSKPGQAGCTTMFPVDAVNTDHGGWADGVYTIIVSARDVLGNIANVNDVTLLIDTMPAYCVLTDMTSIISPANADGYADALRIELTITEECQAAFYLLNGDKEQLFRLTNPQYNGLDAVLSWNGADSESNYLSDGNYWVMYRTVDGAGNSHEDVLPASFVIDNTAPEISIVSSSSTRVVNRGDQAEFVVSINEPGVISVTVFSGTTEMYRGQMTAATPCTLTVPWIVPADAEPGEYTVIIDATDAARNTSILPVWNCTVVSDHTPPVSTYLIAGNSYEHDGVTYIAKASTVVLSAEDDTSGVKAIMYTLESLDAVYAEPIAFPGQGVYELTFWAIDNAGNQENKKTVSFTVDNTPPLILISGVEEKTYRTSVLPEVKVTDQILDHYDIILDGAPFAEHTEITVRGSHTLTVQAYDLVGNYSEKSITFVIDRNFVPTVQGLDFYFISDSLVKVMWNRCEIPDLKGYRCYINTKPLRPFGAHGHGFFPWKSLITKEWVILHVKPGTMKIEISAVDSRRNQSRKSEALYITTSHKLKTFSPHWLAKKTAPLKELHIKGWSVEKDDFKLEYAFLGEDGDRLEWRLLYNGVFKGRYFDYIFNPEESDIGKKIAFRVSAGIRTKTCYAGYVMTIKALDCKQKRRGK